MPSGNYKGVANPADSFTATALQYHGTVPKYVLISLNDKVR
jgi:hypothetical protein